MANFAAIIGVIGCCIVSIITRRSEKWSNYFGEPPKKQLQTDVELQLRKAGIRIFTSEELQRVPGHPWLYVEVNAILNSHGLVIYNILVMLNQRAFLETNASSATGFTWSVDGVGTVGVHDLNTVRIYVRDNVDQFINAYLSVNPRPAGSAAPSSTAPRRDLVRQVQERLQTVGFNPGTIDGTMGPQTRDALRWFQNTKGLRPTGEPDEATLEALDVR